MVSDLGTELKFLIQKLSNTIENDIIEPLSTLKDLTGSLRHSDSCASDQSNQILSFLPSIITTLQTKSKFNEKGLEYITEILTNVLLSIQSNISSTKYLESLRNSIEIDRPLYQNYLQDLRIGSWNPENSCDQEWRQQLQVGARVDAVKLDKQYDRKCWGKAIIYDIDIEDSLYLRFEEEGKDWDRVIARDSNEIGIYNTHSKFDSWRDALVPGSLVDCFDNTSFWYNSTVLDKRIVTNSHGTNTTEVLIAFRVYESNADKNDEKGFYRGWSSKYDEWISIRSPRLTLFGLCARLWSATHVTFNEEKIIDDSNDMLEDTPDTYCVTRAKYSNSIILIKVLNRFGKAGNFDYMLSVLKDTEKWPSFDVVYTITYFVGKIQGLFHKKFAMNYILQFKDAVFDCLLNAPMNFYREYSKEKLDVMFELIESLLRRVLTIQQKNTTVDEFLLEFSLKNFKTPYLERRIHGLKGIIDAVTKSKNNKSRGIKASELVKWLQTHDIISEIFGLNSHYQLVQRTAEILKLLANESALTTDHLLKIWLASQRNDEDLRKSVYKVFTEISITLKSDSLEFIVDKVSELPSSKIQKEEIELIYELTKYTVRAGNASNKACKFFYDIIIYSTEYNDHIKSLCLESYCNILKSWEKAKTRPTVMAQCVESIRENRSTVYAMKIIEKLLNTYSVTYSSKESPTRNSITQELINEQGALTALFDNMKNFKSLYNKDSILSPTYYEEIQKRLNFIKILISECYAIKFSERQLDFLWELFYNQALDDLEKGVFIKWLSETTASQISSKKLFEDSDIKNFFNNKILRPENDFANMSTEELTVFKNCFFIVNLSLCKIKHVSNSMSSSNSEIISEFIYEVLVPPIRLEGMECLRRIVINSLNEKVTQQSSDLLYNLYNHINGHDLKEIREEILNYFLDLIRKGSVENKKRTLEVLKMFIEECEKDGTGNLKSHNALLKGDLYSITVINNIAYHPYSPDIPKKFEIKTYSNNTLWHLRYLIGKKVKCFYDQFRIFKNNSLIEIKDRENGKTLSNLRFRVSETITIYRRVINKPKANLINDKNQLTPKAEKIFKSWFYKYADKGDKMSPEGCAAFTGSCTGDPCKPTDKRTQDFFAANDDDNDGLITEENFLNFYTNSCIKKPATVWNNLSSHHYTHDLRRFDDSEDEETIDLESLPNMILIKDQSNFDLFFSILKEKNLANEAWELLCKLPTSPKIFQEISEANETTDWERVFGVDSRHGLVYILQIVESFMQHSPEEDQAKFCNKREWKLNFIKSNGLTSLFYILNNLETHLDYFKKVCLGTVLKIMCVFILAAFAAKKPEIFETVELVRKESYDLEKPEEPLAADEPQKKLVITEELNINEESSSFKTLVEDIIHENLSDSIINTLDFSKLIESLMTLMSNTMIKEDFELEDKHILDSALELWISCILHNNQLLGFVYNFNGPFSFQEFFIISLTKSNVQAASKSFCQAYVSISSKVKYNPQMPVPYFLEILLGFIQNTENYIESIYLFDLTAQLVSFDVVSPSQNYLALAEYLVYRLFSHPYTERKNNSNSDKALLGMLRLSDTIFFYFPDVIEKTFDETTVQKFFQEFLFPQPLLYEDFKYEFEYLQNGCQLEPPKSKQRDTRAAAYKLLTTLSMKNVKITKTLISCLKKIKENLKPCKSWAYSPISELRSMHGYAGIINLGSICYMNSMLQQFYMIPQFRYSILDAEDFILPALTKYTDKNKNEIEVDDNILHQLQRLFGYLEITDRHAYNPVSFCYSFKDSAGNPVNTSIQQDSQEFLNMILDKLETSLSKTCYKHLIEGTFGGKTSNQVICKECNNINESFEDFYNLSLDVKHSKNVYDSLQKLILEDTICDYYCGKCDKKVEIAKRTVISKLPNILILHLQRIIFNFDTYTNEKINTRLEFPLDLNMFNYTKEGVSGEESNDNYDYELVGIVVHTGTADLGHYYSYIKDKSDNKKWLEFNDSSIRSFK